MRYPNSQSFRIFEALLIAVTVALITYFHYTTLHVEFMSHAALHILLRRLYYIPIIYAAIRFGIKGGLLTSLSATVLFAPHAASSMGGLFATGSIDNFFDIILYNVVAATTGLVVDSRRRQAHRYEEMLALNQEIESRESDLRQIKAYTESILNSVGSGVISVDHRGRIVTANPVAGEMLDRPIDDLVAFPLRQAFAGHDDLLRAADLVLAGEQKRMTLEIELASGAKKPLSAAVRITPHRSNNKTVGIVISMEDLTEVKELTHQLLRADKLSGLGELVTGVAHEVRNPLGVIRASVQMMRDELGEGCQAEELCQVMLQEIDRLNAFVNTLLDFGRPSESQLGPVDARRTLDEVVLLTRQYASQQQVEISISSPEGLREIWADEGRIRQVFINLVSNAIQSMPDGGDLDIALVADDGYLKISFTDTGVGIPESIRSRVFDPFVTARPDGSGLGLSIVHRIVDGHRGYITVDSEVGSGTRFTLGLPLASRSNTTEDDADA
ncbi:MAG: two-component system sensor histidine kinase NtrB [Thermoleophilia bacterium]